MRIISWALASSVVLLACSAPAPTKITQRAGTTNDDRSGTLERPSSGDDPTPIQGDDLEPPETNTPPEPKDPPPVVQGDADGDGIADNEDCDPSSSAVQGTKLVFDDLATQKNLFAPADGFPTASWAYDGAAYRQVRMADAGDVSFVVGDKAVGDAVLEVSSASTEISTTITPVLRQVLVLLGASITEGKLSAVGCGVEVVGGEAVTQKTSVVRLEGPPAAVVTTPILRADRVAVQVNEVFSIKARLAKGTLTCEVTNGGKTTMASATNLQNLTGAVGFYTRQTKTLFKQARFCKLK
jgi:hypothetical protein